MVIISGKSVTVTGFRQSECLRNLSTKTEKQLSFQEDFSLMTKMKITEPDYQQFAIHNDFIFLELITS